MVQMIRDKHGLSERIAIYDLSQVYAGKPICLKFNKTDSAVFREFERFLESKYNIEFKSYYQPNL